MVYIEFGGGGVNVNRAMDVLRNVLVLLLRPGDGAADTACAISIQSIVLLLLLTSTASHL
jgi:hypothetical protein